MAKKAKKLHLATAETKKTCRQCVCSHDWFSKAHDGSMLLGYCQYRKEGKYAILLDDEACQNFTQSNE